MIPLCDPVQRHDAVGLRFWCEHSNKATAENKVWMESIDLGKVLLQLCPQCCERLAQHMDIVHAVILDRDLATDHEHLSSGA